MQLHEVKLVAVQARSSVGEHYLDTVGVGGSIPPVPTIMHPISRGNQEAFSSVCAHCLSFYGLLV